MAGAAKKKPHKPTRGTQWSARGLLHGAHEAPEDRSLETCWKAGGGEMERPAPVQRWTAAWRRCISGCTWTHLAVGELWAI